MTELTFFLLICAAVLAVINWKIGLALCVLTGILQDPLRKLVPDTPVYFVVLIGVVFAGTWLGASMSRVRLGPSAIPGWRKNVGLPFGLFLFLVFAQAVHSFTSFGSPLATGIGLLVWLAPIPAILIAYQFAIRVGIRGVNRWMAFYVAAALTSLSGVYLEYLGLDWKALGAVGVGLIFHLPGVIMKAYSGFFRSSEIAAWHTAAIACFLFILFLGKRVTLPKLLFGAALFALLLSLGILTGRRKMLVEVAVFVSVYVFLTALYQRGATRVAGIVAVLGAVCYVGIVGLVDPDPVARSVTQRSFVGSTDRYRAYTTRGQSVFEDIPERFNNLGIQPVSWALDQFGWFGAGLGTGSQGVNVGINSAAAEGGIGKITVELGVPGLFLMAWLALALAKHIRQVLAVTTRLSLPHARMANGLVAFLVANVATFSVASQAYSDLFILLLLGWSFGFLLAMPVLAARGDSATKSRALQKDKPIQLRPLAQSN